MIPVAIPGVSQQKRCEQHELPLSFAHSTGADAGRDPSPGLGGQAHPTEGARPAAAPAGPAAQEGRARLRFNGAAAAELLTLNVTLPGR
jgi:hypothetical protein